MHFKYENQNTMLSSDPFYITSNRKELANNAVTATNRRAVNLVQHAE